MNRRRAMWAGLGACVAAPLVLWLAVVLVDFPESWLGRDEVESVRMTDRHGRPLREALSAAETRGAWRRLDEVSPWVLRGLVSIEDHRFERHGGVDLRGVARAAWENLLAGRVVAGGSTITQQLVKRVAPQPRTLWGKAREALWALRLERARSKAEILEEYVNRAPFGQGAVGVEAAARLYFDKGAAALSLAEAALLAGLPRAPSRDNPFTSPERARARQRAVLRRMRALGTIDDAQLAESLAAELRFTRRERAFAAPHFTSWALPRAGRGTVRTTLDLGLQEEVERLARQTVAELAERGVGQAAVVVLDNGGEVLAWVGSPDFFAPNGGQVDMVVGLRQPGSTLKPFVYGLGLERGLTAATMLPDLPLWFPTGLGDYRPRNYDRRFHGWVRLREALANSYNVPAVWMASWLGVGAVYGRLRAVGFDSLRQPAVHYGLGLALGNGEVRLLELANAYRALANGGLRSEVRWRADDPPKAEERVMPAPIAALVADVLSDPVARVPAFGRDTALDLPFPVAAKTGTSTDFTDNWTVGFSSEVTVAVWVGNFDGRPMESVSGVTGAGALFHRAMRAAMEGRVGRPFSTEGLERVRICADTGAPWTPECGRPYDELFVPGTAPTLSLPARAPEVEAVRVTFPDSGDAFQATTDTPERYSRLQLRAQAPAEVAALVWEIDGRPQAPVPRPFARWWPLRKGKHVLRVWPAGRPEAASRPVRFEVLD